MGAAIRCRMTGCPSPVRSRNLCETHYRRALSMGKYGYRDAGSARERLTQLRDAHWTYEQIAAASGLMATVVRDVHVGRYRRVMVETERAILRVPARSMESHLGVDATGTRRRVQALMWLGWPIQDISRWVGLVPKSLSTMCTPSRGRVSARTANRVAEVYEHLSGTAGTDKHTRTKAVRAGYAPPLAWDDETIDDPAAAPCRGAPPARRRHTGAADPAEFDWLVSCGESREQAAKQVGASVASIERARQRRAAA